MNHSGSSSEDDPDSVMEQDSDESEQGEDEGLEVEGSELGFDEVMRRIDPYLKEGVDKQKLKEHLDNLGVETVSDILDVTSNRIIEYIKPVKFAKLKKTLVAKAKAPDFDGELMRYLNASIGPSIKSKVEKNTALLYPDERKRFVYYVADALYDKIPQNIKSNLILRIAKHFAFKYQKSFGGDIGDQSHLIQAAHRLRDAIKDRYYYYKSRVRARNGNESVVKRSAATAAKTSGLDPDRDNPSELPDGKTLEDLEDIRKKLKVMKEKNEFSMTKVQSLMKLTYAVIRHDIIKELTLDKLLLRWPFLSNKAVFVQHFCHLMDVSMAEVKETAMEILPTWIKYFQYCSQGRQRKKGEEHSERKLRTILVTAASQDRSLESILITVILCVVEKLKIPTQLLFTYFEEGSNYHDVGAHRFGSTAPIIAVLGSNLQSNPEVFLVAENIVLRESTTKLSDALLEVVMMYYVLRVPWEREIAPVLEFVQWLLFKIETWDSSRVKRKRYEKGSYAQSTKGMCRPLARLVDMFNEYRAHHHFD